MDRISNFPLVLHTSSQCGASLKTSGTVHPVSCHIDTEGDYRYNFTTSLTAALGGSELLKPHLSRFTPGNDPEPVVQEAVRVLN